MENYKDNPVPSLDEVFKKVLAIIPKPKFQDDYHLGYVKGATAMYDALKNGVETDNGQPNDGKIVGCMDCKKTHLTERQMANCGCLGEELSKQLLKKLG